jgi:hypothetical protein
MQSGPDSSGENSAQKFFAKIELKDKAGSNFHKENPAQNFAQGINLL